MTRTATDTRSYDELVDAARNGDQSVTAAQLTDAKAKAEHDRLVAEGEAFLAEQQRLAQLDAEREAWRASYAKQKAEALTAGRQAYMALITDAHARLARAIDAYNQVLVAGAARAAELGIPEEAEHGQQLQPNRIIDAAEADSKGLHRTSGGMGVSGEHIDWPTLIRHEFHPPEWADAFDEQRRLEAIAWATPIIEENRARREADIAKRAAARPNQNGHAA